MIRRDIEREVKGKYPSFDNDDVSRLFGMARADVSKSLWDHAEDLSKRHGVVKEKMKDEIAKELGIDLTEWKKRNEMKEQAAKGGALAFLKGFKPSFKKGEKKAHPRDMAAEYLDNIEGG